MKRFAVRHVTPADAAMWARLRTLLWPDGTEQQHSEEIEAFFRDELTEPNAVLIAEDSHEHAVGFVELSLRTDVPECGDKLTGYVEGLYVAEEMRGSDLALVLLRVAQAWAREQRCVAFASDRNDRVIVDRRYERVENAKP